MPADLVMKMRERYRDLPLMVFLRSVERASDATDLFEILEDVPKEFPLAWDFEKRRWVVVSGPPPWLI